MSPGSGWRKAISSQQTRGEHIGRPCFGATRSKLGFGALELCRRGHARLEHAELERYRLTRQGVIGVQPSLFGVDFHDAQKYELAVFPLRFELITE